MLPGRHARQQREAAVHLREVRVRKRRVHFQVAGVRRKAESQQVHRLGPRHVSLVGFIDYSDDFQRRDRLLLPVSGGEQHGRENSPHRPVVVAGLVDGQRNRLWRTRGRVQIHAVQRALVDDRHAVGRRRVQRHVVETESTLLVG